MMKIYPSYNLFEKRNICYASVYFMYLLYIHGISFCAIGKCRIMFEIDSADAQYLSCRFGFLTRSDVDV